MLVRLPVDVLLEILDYLDFKTLISCQATCRHLKSVFYHSIPLQYKIELLACGMLDDVRESEQSVGVAERFRRLQLYDNAWRQLQWTKQATFTHLHGLLPPEPFSVSLSNEDIVFSRDNESLHPPSTTMVLQRLPSALRGVEEWHREVVAHGKLHNVMIDSSQDLLIWGEAMTNEWPRHCHHLRSLSTGDPHPMAFDLSTVSLQTESNLFNEMATDVCGDYLLLEMLSNRHHIWKYMVCNWKTGEIVYKGEQPPGQRYERRRFLDPYHLVMDVSTPSSGKPLGVAGIKVVRLRVDPSTTTAPHRGPRTTSHSHLFMFPASTQHPGTLVLSHMSPWRAGPGGAPGCFHSDPVDRLLAIDVTVIRRPGSMSIHVPARTLLDYVRLHPGTTVVPWDVWGPQGARATHQGHPMDGFPVHGMRTVVVPNDLSSSRPTMTVLDYHPRRVARALARQRDCDPGVTIVHGGDIYDHDEMLRVKTALPCLSVELPLSDELVELIREEEASPCVFLCEDGVVIVEMEPMTDPEVVRNVWTFSI